MPRSTRQREEGGCEGSRAGLRRAPFGEPDFSVRIARRGGPSVRPGFGKEVDDGGRLVDGIEVGQCSVDRALGDGEDGEVGGAVMIQCQAALRRRAATSQRAP